MARIIQADDYPAEPVKKDCIRQIYRIIVNGNIIKEGRHAKKQTKSIDNRVILQRRFNVSKNKWKDDGWQSLPEPAVNQQSKAK